MTSATPVRRTRLIAAVVSVLLAAAAVTTSSRPAAAQGGSACVRGVAVLLHDLLSKPSTMQPLADVLQADGWCTVVPDHGRNAPPFDFLPGGTRGIDHSAGQVGELIAAQRAAHPGRRVVVVAHGVGALAALRAAQQGPGSAADQLVALGPLWNGTNIALIGSVEQLSRDLGTYPLVLAIEAPLEDPVCRVCREIIQGSDFLGDLRSAGLEPPGLSITNIISRTDLLVVPPRSGELPGATTVYVQDRQRWNLVHHWAMPRDRTVIALVREALAR